MEEPFHPEPQDWVLGHMLKALADSNRLHMVKTMHELGPCDCSGTYADLGLTKSNATHHLRVLRESGLVRRT